MIKFLQKKRKWIASFLLLTVTQNIVCLPLLYALSTGPEQVEYASFEAAEASDMVNLLTGDFNYTMPVIDVPGPEGSFPVPLFYHAGITPEQDASWVGLGWNINPGCITRDVVGYADDAYDHPQSVNVVDPGGRAYIKNYVFYRRTWDSQKGYGGAITLFDIVGAEWDNSTGLKSGTLLGMNFNKGGVKGGWIENTYKVGRAIFSIASFGASVGAASKAGAAAKNTAMDIARTGLQVGTQLYAGYLKQGTFNSKYFNWDVSTDVSHLGFRVDRKYWLDDTRTERGFGSLYLGSTHKSNIDPVSDPNFSGTSNLWPRIFQASGQLEDYSPVKGFKRTISGLSTSAATASDMYTYIGPDQVYGEHIGSTHISYDQFSVMSSGVGGSISPYRLEIGSLAQPKRFSFHNYSHNVVPFIEEDNSANKVQFYYGGQFSNRYLYHDDASFGINTSVGDYDDKKFLIFDITSSKLKDARVETDNTRINGKKIVSGKNIEWYSNEEILSGAAAAQGFIDAPNQRPSGTAPKGIGGFSITKEDGVTYHYAIPVYKRLEIDLAGKKGEEEQKYSRAVNQNPVAISWLLTAITGPDFVDRGQVGLVDDADWGYWVKLDYGQTSSDYWFRAPYYGYFEDGSTVSFSQGKRDQYYLNSIETRTHKALFIKGVRTDGLSSYLKKNDPASGHNTETGLATPTPSLFLDEIILLTKSDFAGLKGLGFSPALNSSLGFAGLSAVNGNLSDVYDLGDIQSNAGYRSFIDSKAIKRIRFVYETDEALKLCKKTLNSFADPGNPPAVDAADIYAGKQGKLTLKRLQFYGRSSAKVFPDYKFNYAYDPDYNKNHWDGWGYYNPAGTSNVFTHQASENDLHGTAWSLTNIVLPTGAKITVDYQRDSYSSISGERVLSNPLNYHSSGEVPFNDLNALGELLVPDPGRFKLGDQVIVEGDVSYSCPGYFPPTFSYDPDGSATKHYEGQYTVVAVGETSINLGENYMGISYCSSDPGTTVTIAQNAGILYKVEKERKGGDIRVSALSFHDEFGHLSKTKYTYENSNGSSSGVVSKEPQFARSGKNVDNFGLDNVYDCASTPVLYGRVTMHSGYSQTTDSYSIKQVYEFETPHKNLVQETRTQIKDELMPGYEPYVENGTIVYTHTTYLKHYLHKIQVKNSRIGKIKSIETLDKNDVRADYQEFVYSEATPADQGKFTSGSILSEFTSLDGALDPHAYRLLRTMKTYHPYVLTRIISTKDGFTNTKDFKAWDFFTGIPLVTDAKSSLSVKTRTENIPAYNVYPGMGLKGLNAANKNMLSQIAASYTYGLDAGDNVLGLIAGNAATWKNNWENYRTYNTTEDKYKDISDGPGIWRRDGSYLWRGEYSKLRSDGLQTFSSADKFNFSVASHPGWKQTDLIHRYDHYSMPLQVINVLNPNELHSSVKMGYGDQLELATASNASYEEFAYSSAEDLQPNGYFGGEIKLGAGSVSTASAHTGVASVSSVGNALIYKVSNLVAGRRYRVSAWTNSTDGRIYYKINGTTQGESPAPSASRKVGTWYLLDVDIPIQGTPFSLEVGVRSATTNAALFDDFRFQPTEAVVTGYVYDPDTRLLEYVVDNFNLYQRYEYDNTGVRVKSYQESLTYGERLISETKMNYRRFHIDQ